MKGEFENRLKGVIDEVKASAQADHPLHRRGAHASSAPAARQGGGDAANLLKPALARGELRTIAATTWSEYKKYFEKDAALERRFQPVKVDEPSVRSRDAHAPRRRPKFEEAHGVVILDEAVIAAARLSSSLHLGPPAPRQGRRPPRHVPPPA